MDNEQPTFGDPSQPFEAQRQALARRRKLAEQLIAKGMEGNTGSGYQGGRVYIVGNPLGNIASSVAGNIFANQNDQQQQQLEQAQRQLQQQLAERFNAATTPAEKQQALLAARDAGVRFDLEKSFYDTEVKQNEAEAIRQAKAAELAAQKESERLWREQQAQAQRDFQANQNALYRRTADQIGARVGGQDAELLGLKKDMLRAQIEAAANKHSPEQAKQGQAQLDLQSTAGLLDMAEPLLGIATSSGVGALRDAAGNLVGASTKAGDAAKQLKAIEGMLISKMPKMSGPQSDKDVLLYRQMAGQIGDPTVPVSQKRAAMATIREITNRQQKLLGAAPTPANPNPSQPVRKKFNPTTGRVE